MPRISMEVNLTVLLVNPELHFWDQPVGLSSFGRVVPSVLPVV